MMMEVSVFWAVSREVKFEDVTCWYNNHVFDSDIASYKPSLQDVNQMI